VLVRLQDDAGRVGLGEASVTSVWSGETQGGTIALIGEDWLRSSSAPTRSIPNDQPPALERAAFGNSFAKAALEMALLDLQGQVLGVPV